MLDRALAVDPRDTDMVVAKGKILLEANRLDDLESLLKNAFLTIDAKSPELLSLRAQLLIALERYDEAVRVWVSAEAEDDIQEYVDSLRETGELQKAEKLVNAAVTQCPGSDLFLRAQGELLLQQRNYQGARQAFHAARAKHPDDTDLLLRETFALRSARMFEEAQQIIDRALRGASRENRPGLLVELGFISYDQGNFEEAAASYDAALAVDPDNGDAYLWKIRALCRSNRRKEAEKVIGQALDRVPIDQALDGVPFGNANVHAQIICEMGKMHETRAEWKAAVKSYNEALDVDPDIAEVSFSKANVLLRLNRNEEADAIVSTILEQRGSDNDVRENAGFFYLKKKDFRKAETQFQELLRRSDSSIQAINGLGAIYFEQGKFDRAEDKFREVLKVDRSSAGSWTNLAWALVRQVRESDNNRESMLADAENNCRKSLELDPNSADAHACLGIIAFKRGKLLQCEELLKRSADLDPADAPYSDLGALYAHLGRYDDAEKVLRKGHDQNPYDATVRLELGNVYLQMGRTKEAITQLKEASAIDPEAARPIGALALALCKSGDLLEALRVLGGAIRRQDPSGTPALRVVLSRVLTELGDKTDDAELYDQALKEAHLAIKAQPGNAEANFQAGVVCFKQNNYPAAIKYFYRCLEFDKDNFEAKQNLRKLKSLKRDEHTRARIGAWVGNIVSVICLVLLLSLWVIYLLQPLPATKETIRQIDSTMLLTMSPILLALIFVSLLMPWLTRLKLPGGVEAELTQPKEQISKGPSGPVSLNLGSSGFGSDR